MGKSTPFSFKNLFFLSLIIAFSFSGLIAQTVTTDKLDYVPGETAYASGTGWLPNEPIVLNVHEEPVYHPDVVTNITADAFGNFSNVAIYDFEQHDFGSSFTLTATGQTNGPVYAYFTDGQLAIWAWRNQPGPTLNSWASGTTIQQANSVYAEGEVIPYRWTSIAGGGSAPNLTEGVTYTIQLDYAFAGGTTSPNKFFHDYLTSYNATEPASVPFGPGSDLAAFQTGNVQTIGVPDDPSVVVGDPSGVFTLFNIDPSSVTFGSYTIQPVNANQEDRLLNITFIPDDGDATPGETLNVGIAWGAHLATQIDYGFENGAANFPGASPQMVIDLDPS
ncbi:MAG: hypothetical protein KJO63_07420, partial [Maribacter sp.]|nr:hypothetical protein [Maribacter sp.]